MARPFVSILIDTYNHERFIEEAVASVLAQDFPSNDREILVVDDGSTDRTPEILAKFTPHIRILRKPNGGQASAFNHALPQCQGEIISMLDGDDWWAPNKVSSAVAGFAAHPSAGIVGHGSVEVYPDGSTRTETIREAPHFRIDSLQGARLFRLRKSFLGTCRMSCRADLLRRILPVPESLVFEADEYIFTLAAFFADIVVLREPLLFYRIHGQNLFHLSGGGLTSARRKHAVLAALADSLRRRLTEEHVPIALSNAVVESIQTEADVLSFPLQAARPSRPSEPNSAITASCMRTHRLCAGFSSASAYFRLSLSLPRNMFHFNGKSRPTPFTAVFAKKFCRSIVPPMSITSTKRVRDEPFGRLPSQPLRILMAAQVPRRREGGGATIIYNMGRELEKRGHSLTYIFQEDLFGQDKISHRFNSLSFSRRLDRYICRNRDKFSIVNLHAPAGLSTASIAVGSAPETCLLM